MATLEHSEKQSQSQSQDLSQEPTQDPSQEPSQEQSQEWSHEQSANETTTLLEILSRGHDGWAAKARVLEDCGSRKFSPRPGDIAWAAALLLLVLASILAVRQQPSLLLVLPGATLSSLGPIPAGSAAGSESTGHSDAPHSGDRHSDTGRSSSSSSTGFELPDPPSRFNASLAWHHMQYRTAESCWSQQERHLYHTAGPSPPSAAFRDALEEFEGMQRECVGLGGVESWQWVRNKDTWNETIPRYGRERRQCRYIAIHDIDRGVGNKITAYVISFVLGLLTNRAIIAPPQGFLTRRFCNPFAHANTSWTVGPYTQRLIAAKVFSHPLLNVSSLATELFTQGDGALAHMRRRVKENGTVWMDLQHRARSEFCDHVWDAIGEAPFWLTSFDAYFLPSLYYVPNFAHRLNQLFPDGRVYTQAARYLLHPDNQLWAEITSVFHANLAHFSHRLGIQIRSPSAIDLPLADRILDCAVNISGYLPATAPLTADAPWTAASESPYEKVGVFVSSLNIRHWMDLQHHYSQHRVVGRALVDFWTDRLLITHVSSFGGTAVGLAGIDAYSMQITVVRSLHLDWRNMTGPVCERVSSEPCDPLGGHVQWGGCKDFQRSGLKHWWEMMPGFGTCPGITFGLQNKNPLMG
ncbi:hypothetical protein CLOP_g10031 [Closterium sp. NIES-67]|nr:hypothetical protein CLOP_g10031 [Closterium sp. NIES-67]